MIKSLEDYQAIKQTTDLSEQIIALYRGNGEPDFELTHKDQNGDEVKLPISKLIEMHENTLKSIATYEKEHPEVLKNS